MFRHIRGIYVVTEKNNRLSKDLRRIKENNYRATDTNAIRNPKEVIVKKKIRRHSQLLLDVDLPIPNTIV